MNQNRLRSNGCALLAALIWGTAFVAQSMGTDYLSAFTFNAVRSAIAFAFLLTLCLLRRLLVREAPFTTSARDLLTAGGCCGAVLTAAAWFQQKGLETTTSGKAGFITALYIVLVPVAGVFLKRKAPPTVWFSVPLGVAGLYCLCISGDFTVVSGDFYVLACSLCFTAHILVIDRFSSRVDGLSLSCVQFFVVSVLSALGAAAGESWTVSAVVSCMGPLLYTGVLSSGIAYTLQILAQKDSNPTVVSLLMSLESVFATVSGALFLHERMTARELLGCALMLSAVVIAQLPSPDRMKFQKSST